MLKALKSKLAKTDFVKKSIETPVDMEIFKEKPSGRFKCGLSLVVFSYIIAWPLISALGILAIYLQEPLVFVIGSPVSYATSHVVFLLGAFIAGKDVVKYMNVFFQWTTGKMFSRFLNIKQGIPISSENNSKTPHL